MRLAIIIPAYNEELAISKTVAVLDNLLKEYIEKKTITSDSYCLVVDDGSTDNTWGIIRQLKEKYSHLKAVSFCKNFGNQSALIAGYQTAYKIGCDGAVTIDADLQQDERKIEDFIKAYNEGYDIVGGVRKSYHNKFGIKSITSHLFYKIVNLMGVNLKPNHSEYRLLSYKALKILSEYKEFNIFVRGMVSNLGLKTKYIEYDIKKRELGKSKFNFASLLALAINGIISFTSYPLRLVFVIGTVISLGCFLVAILILMEQLFQVELFYDIEFYKVWSTFISGIQILCLGVIGEYIGQVLLEVKGRPRYIIEEEIM